MKTPSQCLGRRACLLIAISAALVVAGRADPTAVEDNDGHFAASFPSAVRRGNRIVDKEIGQIATFQVYASQGAVAFMVTYSDYPDGYVAKTGAATVYRDAAKGAAEDAKGTVRGEENCKLGDVAGLEVVIDGPDRGYVERMRLYVVGDRLFQVTYVGPPDSEAGKAALDFLDSFRLLPVPVSK